MLVAVSCLTAGAGRAEQRIALIIGNGHYQAVTPLQNPASDAELMAASLQAVGFSVTRLIDSDLGAMKQGISEFGRALRNAGPDTTALFYYAGHAVQSFGNNYLLPVESVIRDRADLDLYGVEADWVLRQLYTARVRTSIVILDACRDNPFGDLPGLDGQGLAEMNAPTGSFIAYATAPGRVALDGTTGNSPFTAALASAITSEPQPIEQLFKSVRIKVLEQTGGRQTPWDSSSLTSNFQFRQNAPAQTSISEAEQRFWDSVKDNGAADQIELFLQLYPQTRFRDEAQQRLSALEAERSLSLVRPGDQGGQAPPPGDAGPITFTSPLTEGEPHIVGKSIEQIFSKGSPMFPPIEGLPEEIWKGQNCSNCHKWTRELLCEQGRFYLTANGAPSMEKKHPLGGTFKQNLRRWAETGCL